MRWSQPLRPGDRVVKATQRMSARLAPPVRQLMALTSRSQRASHAVRRVTRYTRGVTRSEWTLPSGARNEAIDSAVYAYAAGLRIGLARAAWNRLEAAARTDEMAPPSPGIHVDSP